MVNQRTVRVVFNKSWRDRNFSPTALIKQLGYQSLENWRYHQRMTMMYNISHRLLAVPPTELVKPQRSTRGHHFKYQTIGTSNNRSKHSFYPRSIPEWNSLNSDIVTAPSVDSFKFRLSKLNCYGHLHPTPNPPPPPPSSLWCPCRDSSTNDADTNSQFQTFLLSLHMGPTFLVSNWPTNLGAIMCGQVNNIVVKLVDSTARNIRPGTPKYMILVSSNLERPRLSAVA